MDKRQERDFIVSRWKAGVSCGQISAELGVTRQAVHSRLKRMGVDLKSGGTKKRKRLDDEKRAANRENKAVDRLVYLGISAEEDRRITEVYGGYKTGKSHPRQRYNMQRRNSAYRGIEWKFSNFGEWWAIWRDEFDKRGRGATNLVMARHDDHGPYSPDNVFLITSSENTSLARTRKLKGGG